MTYRQKYLETQRYHQKTASPETNLPEKHSSGMATMAAQNIVNKDGITEYPLETSVNSLDAGDDCTKVVATTSPDKTPSRSRIPLPHQKKSTPTLHRDYMCHLQLETRLAKKNAENERLEQELKAARSSLSERLKEVANANRDSQEVRGDHLRLKIDMQRVKTQLDQTKKELNDVTNQRDVAVDEHKIMLARQSQAGWRASSLFLVVENVALLIVFLYFAYLEYQAEMDRQALQANSWF